MGNIFGIFVREIFLKERQLSFTFSLYCLWNRYFWKKVLWKRNKSMKEIFLKERQQSFTFSIHCLWNRYFWKKVLWKRNPWKKYFWKRDNKALHFHSPLLVHLRFHKTTHICGWTVSGFDTFYIILSSNTMVDHFKTYTRFTQFT